MCECKCKFDGRKCNSDQKWINDKCRCECKKHDICEKDYIWDPATCSCKNGKYLASIDDDSVITCDEVIDADADAESNDETSFNEKKEPAKCKISIFYLHFY